MSLPVAKLGGPYGLVYDVGAFRGDFARACLAAWPSCAVLSFEPLEPRPRDAHWQWCPFALGAESGPATINRCEFVPSSSLLPMADLHKEAFPYAASSRPAEVIVRRLDEFGPIADVGRSLVKIDVQGFELEVVRGGAETIRAASGVVLEVSWDVLYHGAPTFSQLDVALSALGLRHVRRVEALRDPRTGALLQSDELWLRP